MIKYIDFGNEARDFAIESPKPTYLCDHFGYESLTLKINDDRNTIYRNRQHAECIFEYEMDEFIGLFKPEIFITIFNY